MTEPGEVRPQIDPEYWGGLFDDGLNPNIHKKKAPNTTYFAPKTVLEETLRHGVIMSVYQTCGGCYYPNNLFDESRDPSDLASWAIYDTEDQLKFLTSIEPNLKIKQARTQLLI